jgi:hypothetical protein
MVQIAPRVSPQLLDVIERLAFRPVPIAEINRLVGAEAERLGLPRPSYERVRTLVHEARQLSVGGTSAERVLLDIATQVRSPMALTELAALPPREKLRDRLDK